MPATGLVVVALVPRIQFWAAGGSVRFYPDLFHLTSGLIQLAQSTQKQWSTTSSFPSYKFLLLRKRKTYRQMSKYVLVSLPLTSIKKFI